MKGKGMVWFYLLVSMIEIICLVILFDKGSALNTDSVTVNEILWEVKNDWNSLNVHENNTNQQYSVIDNQGNVLYQSEAGISTSDRKSTSELQSQR